MAVGDLDDGPIPGPPPLATGIIGELFWNIAEAVVILDHGRALRWNPAAQELFGIGDGVSRPQSFDPDAIFGAAAGELLAIAEHGGVADVHCVGGCDRHFSARAWHIGDDPRRPSVLVLRDRTAEHRHIDALERLNGIARQLLAERSAEVLYQRIVDQAAALVHAPFSAMIVLRDGSSDAIEHFAYHAPRELFPTRLPRCVGLLAVPIQTGSPVRLDDIRGLPTAVGIPVQHPPIGPLLAVPIHGRHGVAGELAVAARPGDRSFDELDEAHLTELAAHAGVAISLAAASAAAEAAEETRVALTRLALHNLRTPLAIAVGASAALRGAEVAPVDQAVLHDTLDRSLLRALKVAEDSVAEGVEPSPSPPTVEQLDPRGLMLELLDDFAELAADRGLNFEVTVDPTIETVTIAGAVVRSALHNLVANALRYAPAGDRVAITCRPDGDHIRFDVTDRGPGIEPRRLRSIFEGGAAADPDPDEPRGAGIGLSISRRLLRAVGGRIGVASQPGQGSTFWITVPATTDSPTVGPR